MLKRTCALILLLLPAAIVYAEAESWDISASEWARPRHGDWLAKEPALVAAIKQFQTEPSARLQIHYPGGDVGVLWAEELQAWLVALGVGSDRIERVPGSGAADRVLLRVVK